MPDTIHDVSPQRSGAGGWGGSEPRLWRSEDLRRIMVGEQVRAILEREYKLDINTCAKILETYLAPNFLPSWYFFSTPPEDIANHFVVISQLLDSNHAYIQQVSANGHVVTYFVNVGRDFPGRLESIIRENIHTGIVSYDSVKTRAGIRIVTIETAGRPDVPPTGIDRAFMDALRERVRQQADQQQYVYAENFLQSLSGNYLLEETRTFPISGRILRHMQVYEEVRRLGEVYIRVEDCTDPVDDEKIVVSERRIMVGSGSPGMGFVVGVLAAVKQRNINLLRSYYDCFIHPDRMERVGVISLYVQPGIELEDLIADIHTLTDVALREEHGNDDGAETRLERIIRVLSAPSATWEERFAQLERLQGLVAGNTDPAVSQESGSFLLNAISDFFAAARFSGIDRSPEAMVRLLGFDDFQQFFVPVQTGNAVTNQLGYRVQHNAARGPYKGGLRLDPIVDFSEVSALAFMMTWKCARSRILFGGGKGGLILNPREFDRHSIAFYDTLTNFGRSLFMVTGSLKDVPAGDVGCGSPEIDILFEGFKSSIRDLALMAYGSKRHVGLIGNNCVVSVEMARAMLRDHFGLNLWDEAMLKELATSERYLNLVCAAQITGKQRLGIPVRTGATGLGLRFAILALVSNLYRDGRWESTAALTDEEQALILRVTAYTTASILSGGGQSAVTETEWARLEAEAFPKLLKDKRVIVQGSGAVGGSVLRELARYGVNFVAVADIGGAVVGEHLDVDDLLGALEASRTHHDRSRRSSVIGATHNVSRIIPGAQEGAAVLELACDILVPAALENAVTRGNALRIDARIIACGSNGTVTPLAEQILERRGIMTIYDFLANQGGVNASYFEWLRNLTERFRYEAEVIHGVPFDIDGMDPYVMPEFRQRIKAILAEEESERTTMAWKGLLRDIMWAAVNEDYREAQAAGVSMKTIGFAQAQLRVLGAQILRMSDAERRRCVLSLSPATRDMLVPVIRHPEAELLNPHAKDVLAELQEMA